jgi:hypothetical protein
MIVFLCIYLIIGLAIALWSISDYDWNEEGEKLDKYDVLGLNLLVCSGITLIWPIVIVMAIRLKDIIDN